MRKKCLAMLLAGGQGSRLGVLTTQTAKPAVPFGGKYRIIDFPLSNCSNSGIDVVGVLTQYRPLELNTYLGAGSSWDLDRVNGGVFVLPPYMRGSTGEWYKGTANAIYQNIAFIEQYDPEYVLILSGDHIYKMDYSKMLDQHIERGADCTIAALTVPWEEAPRFGIINTDDEGRIVEFEEKPKNPKSNQASMGIYIFTWKVLKQYLEMDEANPNSHNDFGGDVLPAMLKDGKAMFTHPFEGYWKDVGTIDSLWEANMDLLETPPRFNLYESGWRIYSRNTAKEPHYVGPAATVHRSIICEGSEIYGTVEHSVVFAGAYVGTLGQVVDSIIMPDARLGTGTVVHRAIVGENAVIGKNCRIGTGDEIAVIGAGVVVPDGAMIPGGVQVDDAYLAKEGLVNA